MVRSTPSLFVTHAAFSPCHVCGHALNPVDLTEFYGKRRCLTTSCEPVVVAHFFFLFRLLVLYSPGFLSHLTLLTSFEGDRVGAGAKRTGSYRSTRGRKRGFPKVREGPKGCGRARARGLSGNGACKHPGMQICYTRGRAGTPDHLYLFPIIVHSR